MANKIYANARFGFREDTLENWITNNPILEKGEPAVISDSEDSRWLKIGDGVTPFNALPWKFAGGTATADKEYNPTSENAQSGIAVAEALETVKVTQTWKKIAEIELTEDAVVSISQDMDGNSFKLKRFKIVAELPTVNTATFLWLKLNNILAISTVASSATASRPSYGIDADYTFDWQFLTCTHNTTAYANSQVYSTPYGHRYSGGMISYPCTSIKLALDTATTQGLPVGAFIRIWGVDA